MNKIILLLALYLVSPSGGFAQSPKVVPPGTPEIGITEQHLRIPANFVKVHDLDIYGSLYVTSFYNEATVKYDLAKATISCWLLEEWTVAGRGWLLNKYLSMGIDTAGFQYLRYLYYPITFLYADPLIDTFYDAYHYEYIINEGGEVCNANRKIITYVKASGMFAGIDQKNQEHLLRLAAALKKRYDL